MLLAALMEGFEHFWKALSYSALKAFLSQCFGFQAVTYFQVWKRQKHHALCGRFYAFYSRCCQGNEPL